MTEGELFSILELLEQVCGILFVYKINVFLYHKNLFYATIMSEYQMVILWQLILKEFGTNIQYISGVDNVVTDI